MERDGGPLSADIAPAAARVARPQGASPAAAGPTSDAASGNLLDLLSGEDRARLLERGRQRIFEAGEEVVRQGSLGDSLFVVEDGELAVVRCLPGDDEEVLLHALPGMLLGEVAVLDGGARAASLRAVRRSVLRVIPLGAFEAQTLHGGAPGHRILLAVLASLHQRLETTRGIAAARIAEKLAGRPQKAPAMWTFQWTPPPENLPATLAMLPAFCELDEAERAALVAHVRVAAIARGTEIVLPEATRPGAVMVLRGAMSAWFDDGRGPEVTFPAVGPGGFVDYAAALALPARPQRWRARSPTQLLRLDPALFEPGALVAPRLLYALSRGLATALRRTTGLSMHFGMAWG